MCDKQTVIIDGLTYTKEYQKNYIILKSIQKNKYGYNITLRIPDKSDKKAFERIVEDYFKREIF